MLDNVGAVWEPGRAGALESFIEEHAADRLVAIVSRRFPPLNLVRDEVPVAAVLGAHDLAFRPWSRPRMPSRSRCGPVRWL